MFLAEPGAEAGDVRVRRGCEYVLQSMQTDRGDFPAHGIQYHKFAPADMLCYDAMTTWALLRLGYRNDPRLERALSFIAQAIKALRALAEVPEGQRSLQMQGVIKAGVAFLLDGDLAHAGYPTKPGMGISRQWFRFGFPRGYQSDILQALDVLTGLGYAHDSRLQPALDFVLQKRRTDGTWLLDETPGVMWVPLEMRGQPSKWITLMALRVLKRAGMLLI